VNAHDRAERVILGTGAVLLALVFWEGLARGWWADLLTPLLGSSAEAWRIKPIFLSSPTAIAVAFYRVFVVTGEIWKDVRVSALEYTLGFLLAGIVGIPLGLAAGWYRRLSYAIEPFLSALNATPQVAFLPLIIMWAGIGLWSKVVVIFLLAVLPIAVNALSGVRTIDARLLRVARSFGSSDWRMFATIILPSSVPFLLTGLRLGVGRAMIGIVVGELYAATAGIGFMINVAGASFQTDKVFVGVIIIALAGLALVEVIRRVERRVEAWRPRVGAT
jgi:ABC-type nitrate/sulfonate/bicarbonate transport system permease component